HLVEAFKAVWFEECADPSPEVGYEKVALYEGVNGWTHAARLREDGWWESKLGRTEDCIHRSPSDLEGELYGQVRMYLKRTIARRIRYSLRRWLGAKKVNPPQEGNRMVQFPLDLDAAIEWVCAGRPAPPCV